MSNEEPNLQKGIDAIKKIANTEKVKKNIDDYFALAQDTCDKFNIFRMVSEKLKETYHSRILKNMLELYPGLCNAFLEHIGVSTSNYARPEITCESDNRIDILIKGAGHCVIIENKINGATDQEGQLCRYYHYCKNELGLDVDKIIYLSLGKLPEEKTFKNSYDDNNQIDTEKHKENVSKVLEKLCILYSASDNDTKTGSDDTYKISLNVKVKQYGADPPKELDAFKKSLATILEKYLKDYLKEQSDNYVDRGRCTLDVEKTIFLQHYIKLLKDTQKNERMLKMSLEFLEGLGEDDMKVLKEIPYILDILSVLDKSSEARRDKSIEEVSNTTNLNKNLFKKTENGWWVERKIANKDDISNFGIWIDVQHTTFYFDKSSGHTYIIDKIKNGDNDIKSYLAISVGQNEQYTKDFFKPTKEHFDVSGDPLKELAKIINEKNGYILDKWNKQGQYAYIREFEWDKENELHKEIESVLNIIKQLP